MIYYRVIGGPQLGCNETHQVAGLFASPSLECVANIIALNDAAAWEQEGSHTAGNSVLVIEAESVRNPHPDEKNNHIDCTDTGEVIIVKGEVVEVVSPTALLKGKVPYPKGYSFLATW